MLQVLPVETLSMTTRDGVRLDADVFRPATGGPYPVLLMRQAYGRGIASTICYAHPAWYAARGYIVVIQDIRGRGTSEGFFTIAEHELNDGVDTIAWAARLPGTTGAVGMYGFSYQGYNQLMAAAAAGPELKAISPAMAPWHPREGWSTNNGALRLQGTLGWATQLAADTARHEGDVAAFTELMRASRALPFYEQVQARPAYMDRYRAISHYQKWLDTPDDDPYWETISPMARLESLSARKLPMLFIGGWYDTFLDPTVRAWRDIAAGSGASTQLVVGPWLHFPWVRKIGATDFGPDADGGMDELQVRFFDRWLKDLDNGIEHDAPVRLFDMGAKAWREFAAWPRESLAFALSGHGKAALDVKDGRLTLGSPAASGTEFVVHDPWRPVPAFGGALGVPNGPADRAAIDTRGDILTFTTAPLTAPLVLAGDVSASLYVGSDRVSFDLSCVLSRVSVTGQVTALTDGYRCVKQGERRDPVVVPMQSTCVTLAAGECLRLAIAGAAFPAYPVNPGTGQDPTTTPSLHALVTTLNVDFGPDRPSCLIVSTP